MSIEICGLVFYIVQAYLSLVKIFFFIMILRSLFGLQVSIPLIS
jgi:hypothetical protein